MNSKQDLRIININESNIEALHCIRQTLTAIKMDIENSTIITGDFNIPLTTVIIKNRKSIRKHKP